MRHYKIKVGIEEYPVDEADIIRIVEAMKTNDMVKLDCGIFRGQSILAVTRDFSKEVHHSMIPSSEHEGTNLLEGGFKKTNSCQLCGNEGGYIGWVIATDDKGNRSVRPCTCKAKQIKGAPKELV